MILRCPNCTNVIPGSSQFCSYCGHATAQVAKAAAFSSQTLPLNVLPTKKASHAVLISIVSVMLLAIAVLSVAIVMIINTKNTVTSAPTVIALQPVTTLTTTAAKASFTTSVATTKGSACPSCLTITPPNSNVTKPASRATPPPLPTASFTPLPTPTLIVTTLLPTSTVPPTPKPVATTQHGKLLFAYTINDGKSGVKKLTLASKKEEVAIDSNFNVAQAVWTTDGNSFVYVTQENDELAINQVSGANNIRLGTGSNPAFSPDGSKLIFVGKDDSQLYIADANGGNLTQLTNSVGPKLGPAFSPDGTRIAYAHKTNNLWQIWVMQANGANPVQVTHISDHARFPVWSPDGQELAFNTTLPDEATPKDIWVIAANGANAHILVTGNQNGRPFWTEDYIFFNSDRDKIPGRNDIYAIKPDGTNLTRITNSGNDLDYYSPVWHKDS